MQTSKTTNCTWQFFKVSLLNKVNVSQVQMLIWVTAGIKGVAFTYPATQINESKKNKKLAEIKCFIVKNYMYSI